MTSLVPPSAPPSFRRIKYPGDGFFREEFFETLEWKAGVLPPLDKEGWHKKKFATPNGSLYRLHIKWLKLGRNSSNKLVRTEFEYDVEEYHPTENQWYCG
jgi:hypothetical protein